MIEKFGGAPSVLVVPCVLSTCDLLPLHFRAGFYAALKRTGPGGYIGIGNQRE
jgi:hypothetical protein